MKNSLLNGRTAVVAGATGAIGRATCASLLQSGATVIALGRNPEKLALLTKSFDTSPHRLVAFNMDRLDQDCWEGVLKVSLQVNSGVDVFIHAVGQIVPGSFVELTPAEIDATIETNLRSVITAAHVIIPHMIKRGSGHFIVIGSLGGIVPMPFETVYATTKFALRGFCLSLHEEVRRYGVTVSLVSTGPVISPMLTLEGSDTRAALTFFSKAADPETIARSIADLLNHRKREIVRPSLERFRAILVSSFPAVFGTLYPLFAAIGRRRLVRYQHRPITFGDQNCG